MGNDKVARKEACKMIWWYFKGTPFGQIVRDYPTVDRDDIHTIILGSKGIRFREKVKRMWDGRNNMRKDGRTWGEHFEKWLFGDGDKGGQK